MLLTVNKYLNIRQERPEVEAGEAGYLNPGDAIELDRVVVGSAVDGNAVWYRSRKGYFYWSGGIAETEFENPGNPLDPALLNALVADLRVTHFSRYRKEIPGLVSLGAGYKAHRSLGGCACCFSCNRPLRPRLEQYHPSLSIKGSGCRPTCSPSPPAPCM